MHSIARVKLGRNLATLHDIWQPYKYSVVTENYNSLMDTHA